MSSSGGIMTDSPKTGNWRIARTFAVLLACMTILGLFGCATPYGVKPANLRDVYEETSSSALTDSQPGTHSRLVLHRYNLLSEFNKDPEAVLQTLHLKALQGDSRRDLRFALAELHFLYGDMLEKSPIVARKNKAPEYFLASAIYAYLFLLEESGEALPSSYDIRFRQACALHNRALGKGLASSAHGTLLLRDEKRKLPLGLLQITIDMRALPWEPANFETIVLADDYLTHGFSVRNRSAGLGVPLIAARSIKQAEMGSRIVPLTAFLRLQGDLQALAQGTARANLEIYSLSGESSVVVNGHNIPLETDATAAVAYALDNPEVWSLGLIRFLSLRNMIEPQIITVQPYEQGRIPVVFVHGTASELVWWAEMYNTLNGDAELRRRYQFWFFRYNSNLPLMESAASLRQLLTEKRRQLDPQGLDPALDQMVVVGHSQGGILTKTTAVDTGDRLWRSLSDTPLDAMEIDPEGREMLHEFLFIRPLSFVKRVVFISTPHRGSFLAQNWVGSLFRRFISLPVTILKGAGSFLAAEKKLKLPIHLEGSMPTSLDGMAPNNPVLLALADVPVSADVAAHSIIAVEGGGNPEEGDDGVVEYTSAHLDGVVSEFIVDSEHSCQGNPATIEEVRRILLVHLKMVDRHPGDV